ncbi:MAG: mechanosensitive ion channel family protein [Cyanobacteriota bacterium]|nr:mechanosensitive ion channel family protein [Cyanobacteriota bacterium]
MPLPFLMHRAVAVLLAAAGSWVLLDLLAGRCPSGSLGRQLLKRVRLSLSATLLLAGLSWWLLSLLTQLGTNAPRSAEQVRDALVALGVMWTLLRCKGVLLRHIQARGMARDETSSQSLYLFDLSNKLITAVVVLIGVIEALELLGVSPQVLLAASGFGAAALGFGARVLIENLLSGVMLYINRPFVIGDLIQIPALNLGGTVSAISIYYTRLLTADQQPLYVPNAVFASNAVVNGKRRSHRELVLDFGLRYSDRSAIEPITTALRDVLRRTAGVAAELPQRVHFRGFGESSLDLRLQCFCSSDLDAALDLQQRLLLAIAAVVEQHGADMPYPTRTLIPAQGAPDLP